ncbi:BREX-1 system adenine-specific DNA-methyltransferase PglX [Aeromonas veronii]|uniref:BREX-1 system adenine-specific DNA-methyltransferase PglX n=1 Tax=Aeromonas veronii TaxID=654 RepID=UPI00191E1773|nr:BREX-1 system adenine-specific DNA-methyltransferase PglX [Aeromonas veronii]MBL0454784.1 BREX-1 system adenine-specific DNA-methyltransferase PglX [Aeromonas veronii]
MSQQDNNQMQQHFYRASAADFGKIPGSPVAYWLSDNFIKAFAQYPGIGCYGTASNGVQTGNNDYFVRNWHEVAQRFDDVKKWFPYNKGGEFRKWYGNNYYYVNWMNDGLEIKSQSNSCIRGEDNYFLPGITWSDITSAKSSFKAFDEGHLFDAKGPSAFFDDEVFHKALGFLNSNVVDILSKTLNPTLSFQIGDFRNLPFQVNVGGVDDVVMELIKISRDVWNSFEFSWGFSRLPLLRLSNGKITISDTYKSLYESWNKTTLEMQRLEEENNRLFIEAYGLQDELTPEVPLSEITLTCNPHYRYGGNLTDDEREARLQSDTLCELISYAIGCMMGRYSLDREGLVYAHAGNEGFTALVEEGAYATFAADEDGILPLSTDSWFADDVATRLEAFVRTVWGTETLEENLQFIADSLCLAAIKPVKKGGETSRETLRRYLSTQFFKDHMKTYKKRPIYWLFSSGKEKAFECLVYLHRYNEATLPRMRTEYVTPLLGQMAGRIERLRLQQTEASTSDAKRIGKEIDSLTKQLAELRAFDDQLKHHADMRITLDLDDGVKVNYGKFGTLLSDVKAITGDKGE